MEPPEGSFLILNRQRRYRINIREIRCFVHELSSALPVKKKLFSIVFITDQAIRRYNRDYRGLDKPTDVLSFSGDHGYLGDVLISVETAYNQAHRSSTLRFRTNLCRLILHGLLHLMGYDHETDNGEMRAIERRFRRRFGC
jgi:probable rRNA maturation factor